MARTGGVRGGGDGGTAASPTAALAPPPATTPAATAADPARDQAIATFLEDWKRLAATLGAPADVDATDRALAGMAERALALAKIAPPETAPGLRGRAVDAQAWRARLAAHHRLDEEAAHSLLDEAGAWLLPSDTNGRILLIQARIGTCAFFADEDADYEAIELLLMELWPLKVAWGEHERKSVPGSFYVEADFFNTRGAIDHQRYRQFRERSALARAELFFGASLALRTAHGEEVSTGVAWAEHNLGMVALDREEPEHAREHLQRSLRMYRRLGESPETALLALGVAGLVAGDLEEARRRLDQALAEAGPNARPAVLLSVHLHLAILGRMVGDVALEAEHAQSLEALLLLDPPAGPLRRFRDDIERRFHLLAPPSGAVAAGTVAATPLPPRAGSLLPPRSPWAIPGRAGHVGAIPECAQAGSVGAIPGVRAPVPRRGDPRCARAGSA